MALVDDLAGLGNQGSDQRADTPSEAWRPRLELDPTGGFLVSMPRPAADTPDQAELLAEFDLDPASWIVTSVRESRWQRYDGEWLRAFRATLRPATTTTVQDNDLDRLCAEIRAWRPRAATKAATGDAAFVVVAADQQIGKRQGDDGTEQSARRILDATEGAVARFKELRKMGRPLASIVLALTGDHVEGIVSQHGRVQGQAVSDLGITQQTRVARRLLMAQVKAFAALAPLTVVAINGNHDESTRQVIADPLDGWNVEIASAVQDACAENEFLAERVTFRYPGSFEQSIALDIHGTMVGMFHGHQAGRDIVKYLSQQALGGTPLGRCDLFLSGHYHSFKCADLSDGGDTFGRFWIQAPTTDPGSAWFRDRQGMESPAGLLTLVVGAGHDPRRDISIISTRRVSA